MKTEGEIRRKYRQVCFRHLKKELEARLADHPVNCRHRSELNACKLENKPCLQRPGRIAICGIFEQANDKDTLKEELKEFFRTRPAAEVAAHYPDVAALMWVLDSTPPDLTPEDRPDELVKRNQELTLELASLKAELANLKSVAFDELMRRFPQTDLSEEPLELPAETQLQTVGSSPPPTRESWITSILARLFP